MFMDRKAALERIKRMSHWVGWDVGLILVACVLTVLLGMRFDLVERFYDYSRAHDSWELDEFALVFITLSVGGLFLSVRRYVQMRREFLRRVRAEEKMEYLALNDSLTGLPNRRAFIQRLENHLANPRGKQCAIVMIDLDRFKPVNDLYGHDTGDRLLQVISQRLEAEVRDDEILARLGGDEFAAMICYVPGDERLERVLTRMVRAAEDRVEIDRVVCRIGTSIGVTVLPAGSQATSSQLLKQADLALYNAKRTGRGRHVYFDDEMNEKAEARSGLEIDLREAIRSGQIEPYYQPLIDLTDGSIEGYEVLARWQHPKHGLVEPERFIPIAEDTGLINELTRALLRTVCEEARNWSDGLFASINISPVQLRNENIVDDILTILGEFGLPASLIEVEITENALIEDIDMATTVLNRMANEGIRLALDDFGTGYASLNHLRSLPFTKLKIDKSFILSMQESEESRKIVNSVLSLSKSLGLTSIAEGVETREVADWLKDAGCGQAQGFYFGRPDPHVLNSILEASANNNVGQLKTLAGKGKADDKAPPLKNGTSDT